MHPHAITIPWSHSSSVTMSSNNQANDILQEMIQLTNSIWLAKWLQTDLWFCAVHTFENSPSMWNMISRYVTVLQLILQCMQNNWHIMVTINTVKLVYTSLTDLMVKVKFSHTRYRVLGPELIPMYRQSARRWLESHPPGGRLPLLSVRPAVTFPAKERHRPSAGTKLYCLVIEAHECEQLAQGCYLEADRRRFEPATFKITSERSTVKPHRPSHTTCISNVKQCYPM